MRPPKPNPDALHFSTQALQPSEWMEVVHDYYGITSARMQIDLWGPEPPLIDLEALPLEGVVLGAGSIGGLRLARTPGLVAADGMDSLLFLAADTTFAGRFQGEAVAAGLLPGSTLATTFGAPAEIYWSGSTGIRSVQVDRRRLQQLLPGLDLDTTHRIRPDDGHAALLLHYADILRSTDLSDPLLRGTVTTHLIDLAALALGAAGDAREIGRGRGQRAARLACIKQELRLLFAEPGLSAADVAGRHGIGVRTLQAWFEQDGTSYSDFLAGLRLDHAAANLRNRLHRHQRIIDIALAAGYSELSTFNRAFRRRFGQTPSEMRRG